MCSKLDSDAQLSTFTFRTFSFQLSTFTFQTFSFQLSNSIQMITFQLSNSIQMITFQLSNSIQMFTFRGIMRMHTNYMPYGQYETYNFELCCHVLYHYCWRTSCYKTACSEDRHRCHYFPLRCHYSKSCARTGAGSVWHGNQ